MCEKCREIEARQYGIGLDRYDESSWALTQLLEEGYNTVRWVNTETACEVCQNLDGTTWDLEEFLAITEHDAPIFSKSHPNCLCYLEVSHPNGAVVEVNYSGIV